MMQYEEHEVEVQRTISTTVKIRAKNALSAAKIADETSYPLPPYEEWNMLDGWTYVVRDPETGEELYEGSAQELEPLTWTRQ